MKIVLKTRFRVPFKKFLLFLTLSLVSAYLYVHHDKRGAPAPATMMALTPIVPEIPLVRPAENPVLVQEVTIGRNQTFSELMKSQGIATDVAQLIYDSARDVYNLAQIHAGKTLTFSMTGDQFSSLKYEIDPLRTLIVKNTDGEMRAEMIERTTETKVNELGGYIYGSLYSSMNRLGEKDELVIQFAEIFEWDVDFFKDLKEGDSFKIVYEKTMVDGQPFGYGKILAAELNNKGKTYTAIGFQRGKNFEYFSPDGKAMKKAFLASPLKFSRVSSGFTTRRYHPVLKRYRPHYGIDYAAPHGTPVRAIGRGNVTLAGWAGGAGKTVKIQHSKDISTVYCHLSRFAPGVRPGAVVSQGQVIGYVGSTGLATGPHLDFRYMQKGKYVNFLRVKTPQDEPLSAAELQSFRASAGIIAEKLTAVALNPASPQLVYMPPNTYQLTEGSW